MKHSSTSRDELPLLPQPPSQYQPDPYRYVIATLFIVIIIINSLSFYGLAPVSTQIAQIYSLSHSTVNLYDSGYMITNLVFGVPIGYLLSYLTIRLNVILTLATAILGAWLRCLVNQNFYFAFIGHYLLGISFSFIRSFIPRVSAVWFPPAHRSNSSAIMYTALITSYALSLYLPYLPINKDAITIAQQPRFKTRLLNFFMIYAIISTVLGIIILIFYREKPKQAVSISATMERLPCAPSFKRLCKNPSFIILTAINSIGISNGVAFQVVEKSAFSRYGVTSEIIGTAGLIATIITLFVPLLCNHLASKYNKFKLFSILGVFANTAAFTLLWLGLSANVGQIFGVVQIITNVAISAIVGLTLELGPELGFPVPEAFSSSFITIILKLSEVILIWVSQALVGIRAISELCFVYFILQIFCCVIIFFMKDVLVRRMVDERQLQKDELENQL